MIDKELADAVVALLPETHKTDKLNVYTGDEGEAPYYCIGGHVEFMGCDRFVRDWRVAGAVMERQGTNTYNALQDADGVWHVNQMAYGKPVLCSSESLPRAINEAGVKASQEQK